MKKESQAPLGNLAQIVGVLCIALVGLMVYGLVAMNRSQAEKAASALADVHDAQTYNRAWALAVNCADTGDYCTFGTGVSQRILAFKEQEQRLGKAQYSEHLQKSQ